MLQWLQDNPQTFTRGTTFLDSRGRAISSSLGKIANPIGNKDFRSLLVIPEDKRVQATDSGADTIYLFIAELNGYKSSEGCEGDAIEHKRDYGLQCYLSNTLHDLDLEVEDDRDELHENIWLQRLYNELDAYYRVDAMTKELALVTGEFNPDTYEHYWSTPVELDAGASMLQYMAMLLNSKALSEMTNMYGEQLSDPWYVEGLSRNMVKKAATPMLYGSTKTPVELWKSNGMQYTVDHIDAYNEALSSGGLGIADRFKDFILNNCKPQPEMEVTIWNDTFNIECNRFYTVGEETRLYKVYDSETTQVRPVYHTSTRKIPDLDQFKRYFQTLLIHNLDSQVADKVCEKVADVGGFIIDIHDAFIINPEDGSMVREYYSDLMEQVRANRGTILEEYFESVGITAAAKEQWINMMEQVEQLPEDFQCGAMALK
jgi:hypothetical protein